MLWLVPLLPLAAGPLLWAAGRGSSRRRLGGMAGAVMAATTAAAVWAAVVRPDTTYPWAVGLELRLAVGDAAAVVTILVPAVALVVIAYAAAHESRRGLARLVALLVTFVGAMELIVLADDLLTLLIGWELVGACSWALIAHAWWDADRPRSAGHAFLVTRFGDLGLFAAAGAALAGTGSLRYDALGRLHGGWLDLFVVGVVLGAVTKSAQLPFSPWLFSAMAGPTSASALLHSATMVAAGAFLLIRLQPVLDEATWFSPTVITIGLLTAIGGGIVAALQHHAKQLLAASTAAQYGLMFVAVGAGIPAAALAFLVTHAVLKAGLFLVAGVAIEAVENPDLGQMRLGRELRMTAAGSAVLAAALAAVPPLGAAWTKETVVAAAGEHAPWLAVGVAVAGGLTAWYAARFHLLAYGRSASPRERSRPLAVRPSRVEVTAIGVTAVASIGFGWVWWPGARATAARIIGGTLPAGAVWETVASIALVAVAIGGAVRVFRAGRLLGGELVGIRAMVADWFAIPALTKAVLVDPTLRGAGVLTRFDTIVLDAPARGVGGIGRSVPGVLARADGRVVDAGVRVTASLAQRLARSGTPVTERAVDGWVLGLGGLVGRSGRGARRLHTGRAHQYYLLIAGGLVAFLVLAALVR